MTHTEQIADLSERLKQAEAERDEWKFNYGNAEQVYCDRIAHIQKERDAALAKLAEVEKLLADIKSDYSHPWPGEDAGTTKHREAILTRINEATK